MPPARNVRTRLGVFGGVFDPVHLGHIRVAESALSAFSLESVLFVPSGRPPHKKRVPAPAEHRLRMLDIALKNRPGLAISDIEIRNPETSYSVHTLEELHRVYPRAEFFFIMGIDAFLDLEAWYRPREVLGLAHLIVVFRPPWRHEQALLSPYVLPDSVPRGIGAQGEGSRTFETRSVAGTSIFFLEGPAMDVSSSHVRGLLASGERVEELLPEGVQSYILSNKLYQVSKGG